MKKLLALALVLMMVVSLAACGGDKDPDTSGSSTTDPVASQQPSNTPDDSTTAPVASQQEPSDTSGNNEEVTFTDGEWPDNEWTENIPKPSFTIGKVEYDGRRELVINFTDVTYDAMEAYSDEIANVYDDATVIKTGTIYKWRTNVHKDDSIIWTIDLETAKDGTGFMTINNWQ